MIGDKDFIRRDRGYLIDAIGRAGGKIRGSNFRCPGHDDSHASGSIYHKDDVWRAKCHVCDWGGDYFDIEARTRGVSVEDVLREVSQEAQAKAPAYATKGQHGLFFPSLDAARDYYRAKGLAVEDTYLYGRDKDSIKMVVFRLREADGKKTFKQAHPVMGGYEMVAPEKPWPLYGLARIERAHSILVVEGEKTVQAVAPYLPEGWVATTSPGGAGKANLADWSLLKGKRKVVLWPDADEPDPKQNGRIHGKEHMEDAAKQIEAIDPQANLYWVDAWGLDLPPKGDAVEFLDKYAGPVAERDRIAGIQTVLERAMPMSASRGLLQRLENIFSGTWSAVEWPWKRIEKYTQALLPGTITVVAGDPGSGKSFLMLQALMYWVLNAICKVAIFELEEEKEYHLHRALAQLDANRHIADVEWVKAHEAEVRDAYDRHKSSMDKLALCIDDAPDKQVTLDQLAQWVEAKAKDGCRIIIIDPVTAAQASDKPWIDDQKFIMAVKATVRQYRCSLILVTHPKKGKRVGADMYDMAGGGAYQRFTQTLLWVEKPKKEEVVTVMRGRQIHPNVTINRVVQIQKTRNGKGAGMDMGFLFDSQTMLFSEQGVIIDEDDIPSYASYGDAETIDPKTGEVLDGPPPEAF